jgi:predicted transcriptional regulator
MSESREPVIYSQELKQRILEIDHRRKIYETVNKYAGAHYREIERKTGLPTGIVRYHLDYLVTYVLIREEREGNNLRYFPKEFKTENVRLLGLLRQESVRKILLHILTHEGCTHEEISRAISLSPSTTTWHLKKLEENSIVAAAKRGRTKNYALAIKDEEIIKLLVTYKESFLDKLVDSVIEMWETQ